MNELNDYLARLGQDLKLLSPSEQDEILAEIESHIEEGLEDPRMGADESEKQAKLLAELGSPTLMADGLSRKIIMNDQNVGKFFGGRAFSLLLVVLYMIAHALAVVSLLAFGLLTDGWVLHPLAVSWHGLFVLVSGECLWRDKQNREAWLLIIGPLLMLTGLGAFSITAVLGAQYAPQELSDLHEQFVWFNLLLGFLMSMVALLYRWPRLIFLWSIVQGVLLVAYPLWWLTLWTYGTLGPPMQVAAIGLVLPLLYLLTGRVLGIRQAISWRISASLGFLLIVVAVVHRAAFVDNAYNLGPAVMDAWLYFVLEAPFMMAFGAFVLSMPFFAARILRDTEPRQIRFPWEALGLLLWGTSTLSLEYLQIGGASGLNSGLLPAAYDTHTWISSEHVVPNGWLPTITWAGWLWQAVRWLVLPYGMLFAIGHLRRIRHIKDKSASWSWSLNASITLLIFLLILAYYTPIGWWLGVRPALSFLFQTTPFDNSLLWLFLASIAPLLAERASEHHDKGWFWRAITLGSLLILFYWGISRFGWLFDPATMHHLATPSLLWVIVGINTFIVALILLALQKWVTIQLQRGVMVFLQQLFVPLAIIGTVGLMWW